MSTPSVTMISGPRPGARFELNVTRTLLGRHPDCEIVLDDGAVSRQHAQITSEGGQLLVEDLHSRNGTFVNDQAVLGRQPLVGGDRLRICDVVFRFDDGIAPLADTDAGLTHDSSRAIMFEDETPTASSKIMSKLDVSDGSHMRLEANPLAKLKAVLEITSNLSKSVSVGDVLPRVLDTLFTIFLQADRGFVALREDDDDRLVPKAVKFRRPEEDDMIRISRTIVDKVMHSKEAVLSADAATDSRFEMSESIADFHIRSMMCAPLVDSEGNSLGVIQIDTLNQRARFQEDDLELLVGVAGPAGMAISNAQMYEDNLRQQALQRDMQMAHRVQQGFLPSRPPDLPGYYFFDFYHAAYEIGGDYYDYVQLPDGRLAVVVADVSGKGIPAALLTAKLSSEVRFCLASEEDPAAAMASVNRTFFMGNWEDRFVTMLFSVLDPATGRVVIVNAGHLPPLLRGSGGAIEMPGEETGGLPLGVEREYPYESFELQMAPGDCMALYTDGLSEAMNPDGQLYGSEKLRTQFADMARDMGELGKHILDDVTRHVSSHPQSDDMCLICFGRGDG